MNKKAEALQRGETIISREPGNFMTPILKSRQPVRLASCYEIPPVFDGSKKEVCYKDKAGDERFIKQDDIVFCKVRGHFYTHLVKAYNPKRGFLICNNHGHDNGWTWNIYGKCVEILPMDYKEEKCSQ